MGKLDFMQQSLDELKDTGLFNTIRTIESAQGAWIIINGKKVLNMCSNNYLGFANNDELKEAAIEAVKKYGVGPGAVRTIAGTMSLHNTLEKKLAEFKRVEAVIQFQSGFNANLGTIPAIVGKNDLIFSDELNHASIIDGCRLSGAKIVRYSHCDPEDLERKILEYKDHTGKKMAITDGVFSMDGDIAPLDKLYEICNKYDVILMTDDAHGEGVLGEAGRGIVDHFGLHGKVDIEIGTLSKAFGIVGGFVAGKKVIIDYLKQKARPFLFSSATTPADVAAAIKAVDILMSSGELVEKLWDNGNYFKEKMKKVGFNTGNSATPITPVIIGDAKLSSQLSAKLFEEDIFAQSIGYPTVPKGKARIRVMISAAHSKEDLDFAIDKFVKVGKELNII